MSLQLIFRKTIQIGQAQNFILISTKNISSSLNFHVKNYRSMHDLGAFDSLAVTIACISLILHAEKVYDTRNFLIYQPKTRYHIKQMHHGTGFSFRHSLIYKFISLV